MKISLLIFMFLSGSWVWAAGELAQSFTLDGQLFKAGTSEPLLDTNAKITVQILDPSKTCLLYEESQFVNTASSNGYYNILVGSVVGDVKRTALDPGRSLPQIFQNLIGISANNAPSQTCAGGVYTPAANHARVFRLIVTPSSTNIADTLSPDTVLDSVPQALVAQTIQGYSPNQLLILGTGDLTQANLQTVFATGNAAKLNTLLAPNPSDYVKRDTNSTVQLPSATSPTSPSAGAIWYDSGQIKYWNGTSAQTLGVSGTGLTSLNLQTGTSQTFASGSAGNFPAINSASDVHTLNVPLASAGASVTSGTISNADYVAFSGKVTNGGGTPSITSGPQASRPAAGVAGRIYIATDTFREFRDNGVGWDQLNVNLTDQTGTLPVSKGGTGQTTPSAALNALLPSQATNNGKVLQTDGTNASWVTPNAGVVTSISGTAPITVGGTAAVPLIGVSAATTGASGVVTLATDGGTTASTVVQATDSRLSNARTPVGTALTSGQIWVGNGSNQAAAVAMSGDATLSNAGVLTLGTVPVSKGGTAATSFTANQMVIANGTGTALQSFSCPTGNILKFNASGVAACDTVAGALGYTPADGANYVAKIGDTMTGTLNLPANGLVAGTNQLVLSGGNVGIGVTSPSAQLDIRRDTSTASIDSTTSLLDLTNRDSTLNNFVPIRFNTVDGNPTYRNGAYFAGNTTGRTGSGVTMDLVFGTTNNTTSASERMRITGAGNVGIGTTNPTTKLEVSGTIKVADGGETCSIAANGGMIRYSGSNLQFCNGGAWQTLGVAGSGISSLTGDVTATGPGAAAATIANDAVTFAKMQNIATNKLIGRSTAATGDPEEISLSSNLSLSGGTLDVGTIPVSKGGTGQTTPSAALNALLPSQATNNGKVLQTDGTNASWVTPNAGVVTSISGTAPITVGGTAAVPLIGVSAATTGASGVVTLATDGGTTASTVVQATDSRLSNARTPVGTALTSGQIWVGNGSNQAAAVAMSGDATLSNAGVLTLGTVPVTKGGTGLTALGTANQVLGVNNAGTGAEYKTITAGTNVSITHGANTLTINATASGGTVTNVSSANSDIGVATGTTTPVLTLNSGTGANQIVKLDGTSRLPAVDGSQLSNLSTSQITSGTLPINRGGTGAASFSANKIVATNGTGSGLIDWSCPVGQMIKFDAGGAVGCDTIANVLGYTPANGTNYVAKAGDTMTGTLNLPANGLVAGTNQLVLSGGNVGIGTTGPSTKLEVSGTIKVADGGETCSIAANGGMIRYIGSNLQFCNGTAWQTLGVAGSGISSLTGDVTATGPGAAAATIANDAVTFAKMQNIATNKLIGRSTAATGDPEEISLSSNLSLSGGTLDIGTVPVTKGGTGLTTTSNNAFLTTNGSGTPSWTAPGTSTVLVSNASNVLTGVGTATTGALLQMQAGGIPAFTTASFPTTTTANQLLYSSATNVVGGLATVNNAVLTTNGSGVPSWGALSSDVFTQYALLAGRAGGQNLRGGTAASENLTLESTSNATKGFVILQPTGGNVGIGTTSPAYVLDVPGIPGFGPRIDMAMDGGPMAWIRARGTGTDSQRAAIGFSANVTTGLIDSVQLSTAGAQRMIVNSTGNVGIGITAPTVGLHVQKDNGSGYAAWFAKNNTADGVGLGSSGSKSMIQGLTSAGAAADLNLQIAGGNVGIGTTGPTTKLEVSGTIKVADGGETCSIAANGGMIRYSGSNLQFCNGTAWQTLGVSGSGISSLTGDVTATGPGAAAATIANDAVTFAKMQNIATNKLIGRSTAATGDPEEISLSSNLSLSGGTLDIGTVPVTKGGTGLTTTSNNAVLTTDGSGVPSWGALSSDIFTQYALLAGRAGGQNLRGGTAASENLTLESTSNATKGYVILQPTGGNVGIGTTSPTSSLHVIRSDANTSVVARLQNSSTTGYSTLDFRNSAGTGVGYVGYSNASAASFPDTVYFGSSSGSSKDVSLVANGAQALTVIPSGNVGIGTTSPGTILDVAGAITSRPSGTGAGQTGQLMMRELATNGTNTYTLKAPDVLGADRVLVFPDSNGTNGQALVTNGSGVLSWASAGASSSGASGAIQYSNGSGGFSSTGGFNYDTTFDSLRISNTAAPATAQTKLQISAPATSSEIRMFNSTTGTTATDGLALQTSSADAKLLNYESGSLALGTAGSDRLTILSGGNVGIGTTSPSASLEVAGTARLNVLQSRDASSSLTINTLSSTAGPGSVYFTSSGGNSFEVAPIASAANWARVFAGAGTDGPLIDAPQSMGLSLSGAGSGVRHFHVSSTGNVGIGTTGPSEKLHVVGNLRVQGSTDCTLGNGSGGTNCSSDIRLKTNVQEIENPLEKILSLRGVEFDWNEKSQSPGDHAIGVIAQDVEKQFPTAVIEDSNTGYKKVDYAVLVAPVIQAFKELNKRITELFSASESHSRRLASVEADKVAKDKEIADLKAKNKELEQRLERLEKSLKSK